MADDSSNDRSIGDLLKDLSGIEREIEESRVERCAVFADVAGYARYLDNYGDVAGRRRLQTAREVVQQSVDEHGGRIIKSIGGGWLILFLSPLDAVLAVVGIQRDLAENQDGASGDRILLRIGVDTGRLLVEPDDVFGEVVNVSQQLAERCLGDEILLSSTTFEKLGPYFQSRCVAISGLTLREKQESATGYRLEWRHDKPLLRGMVPEKKAVVEIHWIGPESHLSLYADPLSTASGQPTDIHTLDLGQIHQLSSQINLTIQKANKAGALRQTSVDLENQGKQLFDLLFPERIRDRIRHLKVDYLVLKLDPACVHIPWELAHDGNDFLCCRFPVGRVVEDAQPVAKSKRPRPQEILSLLVVSDPCANLPTAYKEGKDLYDLTRKDFRVNMEWLNGRVSAKEVSVRLARFDAVHYCGHGEHELSSPEESGWLLRDGRLSADSLKIYGGQEEALALLVFNNACHGGTTLVDDDDTATWSQGLAHAFLRAGCHHYIGAVSELLDSGSNEFARFFYRSLLAGYPVGRALHHARLAFRNSENANSLTWAQYVHYGDPDDGVFALPENTPPAPLPGQPLRTAESLSRRQLLRRHLKTGFAFSSVMIPFCLAVAYWFDVPRHLGDWFGDRSGRSTAPAERIGPLDRWTSRPLSLVVLPPFTLSQSIQANLPSDLSDFGECLRSAFADRGLAVASNAQVVEVLQDLKLKTPDVAGPANSARVGRQLGVRFLVLPRLHLRNGAPYLGLQILDTVRRILAVTEVTPLGQMPRESISRVVETAADSIKKKYPLQGKVTHSGPAGILLNIGSEIGVKTGDLFEVFPPADDHLPEDVLKPGEPVATLTVESVEGQVCRGSAPPTGVKIEPGMRVRRKEQ